MAGQGLGQSEWASSHLTIKRVRLLTKSPTPCNTPRVRWGLKGPERGSPRPSSSHHAPSKTLGPWGCPRKYPWATCAHSPAELSALGRGQSEKQEWKAREGPAWRGPGPVRVWTEEVAAPQTRATALERGLQADICPQRVPASSRCLTKWANVDRKLTLSN